MTTRILVTGSRGWSDRGAIASALRDAWTELGSPDDAVLVSGACPSSADIIAETIWANAGLTVERHPADWATHGRAAGPIRNNLMVAMGADVCLAFIKDDSRGASQCSASAEKAGIKTIRFFSG